MDEHNDFTARMLSTVSLMTILKNGNNPKAPLLGPGYGTVRHPLNATIKMVT
jgi:hypothetical protein